MLTETTVRAETTETTLAELDTHIADLVGRLEQATSDLTATRTRGQRRDRADRRPGRP